MQGRRRAIKPAHKNPACRAGRMIKDRPRRLEAA